MRHDKRVLIVKKKVPISKDLNVLRAWNVIAPIVAREIGAPDYTPVPNFYTNAYQIGHIFVPTSMQVITIFSTFLNLLCELIFCKTGDVFPRRASIESSRTDTRLCGGGRYGCQMAR